MPCGESWDMSTKRIGQHRSGVDLNRGRELSEPPRCHIWDSGAHQANRMDCRGEISREPALTMTGMRKTRGVLIVVAALVLFVALSGCSRARENSRVAQTSYGGEMASPGAPPSDGVMAEEAVAADKVGDVEVAQATTATGGAGNIARRIIKTGEMTLEVRDLRKTMEDIAKLAEDAGGYVSGREAYEDDEGGRSGKVTVRIPSDKFAEIFKQLQDFGKAIRYSEDAQDVTEEWVDLEARIANKKAEEEALLALLKRKGELSDILEVQREVFRARGEVEQLQGRLRYLKDQVSLSTIEMYINELGPAGLAERGPWRIAYHLRTAWHALARIVEWLVYATIYLIIPGVLFWGPIVLLIWWVRRRRRARRLEQS